MTRLKGYIIITLVAIAIVAVMFYIGGLLVPDTPTQLKFFRGLAGGCMYFFCAMIGHESYLRKHG